jgi:replicative DNA helicase
LQRAEARLATLPIYIDDTFATSAPDVRRRTLRLMSEASIDLLIVDYIQLLDAPGRGGGSRSSRVQEVSEISAELRKLAKELDIPIVALAQLNREVEKRGGNGGKEHKLSDLRESGSLEQDAAIVIFIHMEQLYDPDTYKEGIAELVVAKHRHGRLARVPVRWCPRTAEFRDLALVPGGYGALGRSVVK